jgi:hypothetical protein
MNNASESTTLWNKPSSEWTSLPRAHVTDKVMDDIRAAIQAPEDNSRERLDRFNIPVSEETLRSRVA